MMSDVTNTLGNQSGGTPRKDRRKAERLYRAQRALDERVVKHAERIWKSKVESSRYCSREA